MFLSTLSYTNLDLLLYFVSHANLPAKHIGARLLAALKPSLFYIELLVQSSVIVRNCLI